MLTKQIKVWDIFIRSFHWVLVIAYAIAFLTEDDWMTLHVNAGYVVLGLLAIRIVYGFIGTRYARFTNFIYSPRTALSYVKDVFTFKAKRYVGHNPAGGLMILVMILALIVTSLTGLVALAFEEKAGPLVGHLTYFPYWILSSAEDVHELFANLSLLLVIAHVAGVIVESIAHNENLILSMITGRKKV